MKRWNVESRRDNTEVFDNYVSDYIEAETQEEAVEFYKQWLVDNGCSLADIEEYEYTVKEW